jgi:hypothetical protein
MRRQFPQIPFQAPTEIQGVQNVAAIGSGFQRHGDPAIHGSGQHETLVVVGVLSDEVHPARGTHDHGRRAEFLPEACQDWNKEFVSGAEAEMLHGQLRERD